MTTTTGRLATRKEDGGTLKEDDFYPINGYPGYLISKDGRVYSKRLKGIMKLEESRNGYMRLFLHNADGYKKFLLHRLVAITFIPNPEQAKEVNHKDGDKSNNSIDNLEWCTTKFNHKHAEVTGLKAKGDSHGMTKLSQSQRTEIVNKYIPWKYSATKLAMEYNVSKPAILYTIKHRQI